MDPTAFVTPCLLAGAALYALRQRVDVFSALTQGAGEGLSVVIRILPGFGSAADGRCICCGLRSQDALAAVLSPVLGALGIPPETAALLLVRPVSGSGALAVGSQLMEQYGPDSAVGRTAAVMLGCSETTFYTVAVYFGAAGIRRTRYTIPAALTADLAAFIAAAWGRAAVLRRRITRFRCCQTAKSVI